MNAQRFKPRHLTVLILARGLLILVASVTLSLAAVTPTQAAGGGSYKSKSADPVDDFDRAVQLIGKERYTRAARVLDRVVDQEPNNADAWNLLGFSLRKSGKLDRAETAYQQALALDPAHRGALEYYGELHLMRGDKAGALALLDRLAKACPEGCEERTELETAIAGFDEPAASSGS
ncbi:MAG: tetratricopeptide repeat protein [Pseudomonadota bacterium]